MPCKFHCMLMLFSAAGMSAIREKYVQPDVSGNVVMSCFMAKFCAEQGVIYESVTSSPEELAWVAQDKKCRVRDVPWFTEMSCHLSYPALILTLKTEIVSQGRFKCTCRTSGGMEVLESYVLRQPGNCAAALQTGRSTIFTTSILIVGLLKVLYM